RPANSLQPKSLSAARALEEACNEMGRHYTPRSPVSKRAKPRGHRGAERSVASDHDRPLPERVGSASERREARRGDLTRGERPGESTGAVAPDDGWELPDPWIDLGGRTMPAILGVPKEIKQDEGRVAISPNGVHVLVEEGHRVLIERSAGYESGITDDEFEEAGAEIVENAREIWANAQIIVKVKEPLAAEYDLIRPGQVVFTFFHFAASRELTDAMIESGATCIAYETIKDDGGRLPVLTPMSEVAGRMSVFEGSKHLESPFGGRGVLVSGVPGVEPAKVVVIGGGVVGSNAARIAAGVGAQVTIFDIQLERLRYLAD